MYIFLDSARRIFEKESTSAEDRGWTVYLEERMLREDKKLTEGVKIGIFGGYITSWICNAI